MNFLGTANPRALRRLQSIMPSSSLGNHVFFHRPEFEKILEEHTLSMIRNHEFSSSLLAFCGSRHVSAAVETAKIANDLTVAMSGYKRHHMEFKSECHGSPRTGKFVSQGGDENGSVLSVDDGSQLTRRSPKSVTESENNGLHSTRCSFSFGQHRDNRVPS